MFNKCTNSDIYFLKPIILSYQCDNQYVYFCFFYEFLSIILYKKRAKQISCNIICRYIERFFFIINLLIILHKTQN